MKESETICRNPVGNHPHPVALASGPEASLAWAFREGDCEA